MAETQYLGLKLPEMSNLKETDIRPDDLLVGQKAAVEADVAFLLARRDEFVACACPACDGVGERVWEKAGFTYDACANCRTVFMNPRPSESLLNDFYVQSENYAYWNKHIFPASEDVRRKQIFEPRADRMLDLIARFDGGKGAFLEVGAGYGTFCAEVSSRDHFERVVALEMTPKLAETCRERGLEVVDCSFETSGLERDCFDVIAAFEVLEHIFNPGDFVQTAHGYLKSNGLIFISCPSADGFDVQTLGTVSDTIDHEHVNYFNPESLRHLLEARGFEVVEVITPGRLDADIVRNKVLRGEFDLSHSPFLENILVRRWEELGENFQKYIADSGQSSHMWAVGRRVD